MAATPQAQAQPASAAVRGRQRRAREEELLVWPDLVFIEFIAAVLFTILIVILAVLVDSVLLDRANAAVTPNPSKAPWYFLNLQELLLHMHPALAGVVVPTVALVALGAIPYFDNSHEGQGEWLSTPGAWRLTWIGTAVGSIGSTLLIFFDESKHVQLYEWIANGKLNGDREAAGFNAWPTQLDFLRGLRGIQNNIAWPDWTLHVPLGDVLRTDLLGFPAIELDWNIPAFLVEQFIPVNTMVGLPLLLSFVAHKMGWARTKRDHMILQFAGFIAVYVTLTIVGTFFRGEGLTLIPYTIFAHE
jgi:quinol-cytochrome oxidoreductase complex cytochrome b subunit